MGVQEMLKEMSNRAFNASYDAYMRNAYDLWAETDFKEEEHDYAKSVQDLDSVLTEEQRKKLKIMEENYRHNMEYASRYGFKAGLYSGFSQFFIGTEAAYDSFEATLMKNLMEMPGMIRHQSFYKRNDDNLCAIINLRRGCLWARNRQKKTKPNIISQEKNLDGPENMPANSLE